MTSWFGSFWKAPVLGGAFLFGDFAPDTITTLSPVQSPTKSARAPTTLTTTGDSGADLLQATVSPMLPLN